MRLVMDFERAMWVGVGSELRLLFPLELSCLAEGTGDRAKPAYVNDEGTHVFIEKILALPFLPARQIEPIFCSLTKDRDGQWKDTIP